MQSIVFKYLNHNYYIADYKGRISVMNKDTRLYCQSANFIYELNQIFNIDNEGLINVLQSWAKNDLKEYLFSPFYNPIYVESDYITTISNADFQPRLGLATRYGSKLVDPTRYGIVAVTNP